MEEVGAGQRRHVTITDMDSYSETLQKVAVTFMVGTMNTSGTEIWRRRMMAARTMSVGLEYELLD